MVKLVRSVLLGAFSLCCPLSVFAGEISYNYSSFGGSFASRQSDHIADDPKWEYELALSLKTFTHSFDENEFGIHFWSNSSWSRNISANSAYTLDLEQITGGIGVYYTFDVLSTFFRIGQGVSFANFKSDFGDASVPLIPTGTDDLFAPPSTIFDQTFSATKREDGNLLQIGIRYRVTEGYEIGASILQSNMDSLGTEFSGYIQRDIEVPVQIPIGTTYTSLKLCTTISDAVQAVGLSLVLWF